MSDWDDVARLALALPESSEGTSYGIRAWLVGKKAFVWDRPLRKADHEALGEGAPDGEILGARLEHEIAKQAMLADPSGLYFTTPHFDGYPIILVRLDPIGMEDLEEVVTEAWLARAPKGLAEAWVEGRG